MPKDDTVGTNENCHSKSPSILGVNGLVIELQNGTQCVTCKHYYARKGSIVKKGRLQKPHGSKAFGLEKPT